MVDTDMLDEIVQLEGGDGCRSVSPSQQLLIAMKFGIVIQVPQRMTPPDLGDPFYRAPPAGHHQFSIIIV